jgi:hypothetical protein
MFDMLTKPTLNELHQRERVIRALAVKQCTEEPRDPETGSRAVRNGFAAPQIDLTEPLSARVVVDHRTRLWERWEQGYVPAVQARQRLQSSFTGRLLKATFIPSAKSKHKDPHYGDRG